MKPGSTWWSRLACVLLFGCIPAAWSAEEATGAVAAESGEEWLSIEELTSVRIISVSREEEELQRAPAAAAVLTAEDIRHTGATVIPEALQWVPGLNVAQINSSMWAVGARGFQWQYANKLLVMIDGRSIYSPTAGGVRWEDNGVFLDDLARIEVVRGPGSSIWGANAVNGVINVVSKSAFETLGTHLYAAGGNELHAYAGARHGARLSETAAMRFYGQYRNADDNVLPTGESAEDASQLGQGGFRLDWEPGPATGITLQGDFYAGENDYVRTFTSLQAPPTYSLASTDPIQTYGANVLGRWRQELGAASRLEWQTYWSLTDRDLPQNTERLNTWDTDLMYQVTLGRHALSAGLGYRFTDGELGPRLYNYDPTQLQTHQFSGFVQDEISLVPERWTLIVGTKVEHHEFTEWEPQPTARLVFTPTTDLTFWGSVARAVRIPTWTEEVAALDAVVYPPGVLDPTLPAAVRIFGNPELESEKLTAYELGARWRTGDKVSIDLAGFYYDYDDYVLATFTAVTNQVAPPAQINAAQFQNGLVGESYGGELAVHWSPWDWWRLQASYSYVQIQLHRTLSDPLDYEQDEFTTPDHTVRLQSALRFGADWQLHLGARWVDEVPYYGISDYVELDARLAWRPNARWEWSLVGRNLLHDAHAEYDSALNRRLTEIQRSVFLQVRCIF